MRVAALVINWNGAEHLPACLDALLAQDHPDLEVVVVDNASEDGSREVLRRYADRVRVVANDTNRGFAGGVNDGAAAAPAADAILTVNPDVTPRPDYVRLAVAALAADDRRGAVQGKLLRTVRAPAGEPVIDTTGHIAFRTRLFRNRGEGEIDRRQWDLAGEVFGVSGALALYRRRMLDDVAIEVDGRREILDEDLFAFWEDVDLDWRARLRGWTAWYEPAAVAEHERGGAGPRRTARVEQLNWQNRLLVLVKCDAWIVLVPALPGFLVTLLLKTAELVLTVPTAFVAVLGDVRLVRRMLAKRSQVHAPGVGHVPTAAVVRTWFEPFDYRVWVRTWWRRVRGVPLGS
ncbi:MAG: glycosyltransferase family 2 protein [Actinobacteria bacterium]|nr:glycosyltransferase family 2 protein [Actinomycetota bacterium]